MNRIQNQTSTRDIYIDFLRIIAMFMVLFIHTNNRGYAMCVDAIGDPLFPFYLFCSAACKIAVPLFLMISGALLLKKDEPISVVLKKRTPRILCVLIAASFVHYVYQLDHNFAEFSA